MELRNLLMVTYHFPPSAASGTFRLLGFARHLPKFGWRTTVVAPPEMPYEPSDPELLKRVPSSTTILETPFPLQAPKVLRWALDKSIWLPRAWSACRRAVRQTHPDAVLTSGPPHWAHLLGLYLKRRHGLPWVADFRDPWISGQRPANVRNAWARFWERRIMKHADLILGNAPQACATYQTAFPEFAHKMVSLTNGYDPESFPVSSSPRTGPLRIVHVGEIYLGRNPSAFLDALQVLHRETKPGEPGFRAAFLGRTDGAGFRLAEEVAKRGLQDVVQGGQQVSYAESLQEMADADILLLLDTPGRRIGVPAKLYEYMGAGNAILTLAEDYSDTALVLRESGLPNRIAPLQDAVRIRTALTELAQECRSPNPRANERLVGFTRESLAGRLAALLNERVAPRPKSA